MFWNFTEAVKASSETKDEIINTPPVIAKKTNPEPHPSEKQRQRPESSENQCQQPESSEKQCQRPVQTIRKEKSINSSPCKSIKASSKQGKAAGLFETVELDEITILPAPVKVPVVIEIDDADDPKVIQISSEDSNNVEYVFPYPYLSQVIYISFKI